MLKDCDKKGYLQRVLQRLIILWKSSHTHAHSHIFILLHRIILSIFYIYKGFHKDLSHLEKAIWIALCMHSKTCFMKSLINSLTLTESLLLTKQITDWNIQMKNETITNLRESSSPYVLKALLQGLLDGGDGINRRLHGEPYGF